MDVDLELPPDDTYAWCLERLLEHPGVSDQAIADAIVAAAPGGDAAALDSALQCRVTLRTLEALVRAGRLDQFVCDSLVKLRELSGEVGAGPRVNPSQLACSEALLIEVRTAAFVEVLREHHLFSEAELLPYLEAAFPRPLSPEARRRALELKAGLSSEQGRDDMADRYRLEPVLSALGQFLTRAKQALGPSVLSIINDDINSGRYLPGEGSLLAPPAVPVARATPVQPQRQQPLGWASVEGASLGAAMSPVRAGAGRAAAAVEHARQAQQQAQHSYPVPKPSFHQGPPVGSPQVPRRSQGGAPSTGHSPSLSLRDAGGRVGARAGQQGRKRGRAAAEPPRGERREPGDFDLPELGGPSAMEEEEAAVAAPKLAKATDKLKATGGADPLPEVLRAAEELQPQRPAAAEEAKEEGEQADSSDGEADDAERRRPPEEHRQHRAQPRAREPELSDDELDGAPNLHMPPQAARKVPLSLQPTGAGARDALRADLLPAPRVALAGGRRKVVRWSEAETNTLLELIMEYGEGSWAAMHADRRAEQNMPGRNQVDLKDKWRNLKKQGYEEVILERRRAFMRQQEGAHAGQGRQQQKLEQEEEAAQQEQEAGDDEEAPQQEQQQQEQEAGQDAAGEEQAAGIDARRQPRRRHKQQEQRQREVGGDGEEAEYEGDGSEPSDEDEEGERRWTQEDEDVPDENEEEDIDEEEDDDDDDADDEEKVGDDDEGAIYFTAPDTAAADGSGQQLVEEEELLTAGDAEAEGQEGAREKPVGQPKRGRAGAGTGGGSGNTPLGKRRKQLQAAQAAAAEAKPSDSKGRQRGKQAQQQDEEVAPAGVSTGTGGGAGSDGGTKRGRGRPRRQPPAPGAAAAGAGEVQKLQAEEQEGAVAGGGSGSEAGAATRSGPRTRSGHKSRSHQSGPSRQAHSQDKPGTTEVVDLVADAGEQYEEQDQDAAAGGDARQEQPGGGGDDGMVE